MKFSKRLNVKFGKIKKIALSADIFVLQEDLDSWLLEDAKFNKIRSSVVSKLAHVFSEYQAVHYFKAEIVTSDHQHWDMLN